MAAAVNPTPFTPGFRLVDGSVLNTNFAHPILSSQDAITAHAGGGKTNAFKLTSRINRVSTVATTADSILLVPAIAGKVLLLINDGANAMQVFGQGTDTINDIATGTGISQPAGEIFEYSCPVGGKWYVTSGLGDSGPIQATTLTASSTVTLSPANAQVTLSPSGTGSVTINPATAGAIDNEVIGGNTPLAGTFTTLTATGAVALNPANFNVVLSPTGTGVVTINPATAGTLNNVAIGGTTPLAVTATTLTATNTVSLSPASHNVTLSPTGTGQVVINPATAGTVDNVVIGGGTPLAGTFTTTSQSGAQTFTAAASGPILKQGANGRVGTFTANGATAVVVSNTSVAATDAIIFSMNTVGGTPAGAPFLSALSAGTSFSVKAAAGDTSTYNYAIIKNAP